MLKRIRSIWSQDLIRPLLHRAFTRLVWGLFFSLFLAFMIKRWGGGDLRSPLLLLWGILCLVGAWLSYLQLDGLRLPRLDQFRTLLDRKRPKRQSGVGSVYLVHGARGFALAVRARSLPSYAQALSNPAQRIFSPRARRSRQGGFI